MALLYWLYWCAVIMIKCSCNTFFVSLFVFCFTLRHKYIHKQHLIFLFFFHFLSTHELAIKTICTQYLFSHAGKCVNARLFQCNDSLYHCCLLLTNCTFVRISQKHKNLTFLGSSRQWRSERKTRELMGKG